MATNEPTPIRFPISSFPGASTQESAGRLVNCYAEPIDDPQQPSAPSNAIWRRSPGLSQLNNAATGQTGYRGGLIVNNLAYEVWANNLSTVDSSGNYNSLGTVNGTAKVSIARNQAATPNVVIVDPTNGAFSSTGGAAPSAYNGGGNLPQPNSVCFQDGYFFFGIADCRVFASGINALTQNALTFITLQSKSDVVGQRVIAYSGLLFGFTSGGLEIWQDTAQPAPAFPYSRQTTLPYGLIQQYAIAGYETGFDDMIWVAQDFATYRLPWGSYTPQKISPPDLDRFIETQVAAGNVLEAGVYEFAGKKFWSVTSNNATSTWEFNLTSQKWNERTSLNSSTGVQSRWRATGGHPAFGKWLMGDIYSGNLLYIDDTNYTENGAPQLFRLESGPVEDFPNQIRIARADFDFVMGVGQAVGSVRATVLGAANNGSGLIRLQLNNTAQMGQGHQLNVSGVTGTTEANGVWAINIIDGFHVDLIGSAFVHAYISGGTAIEVTQPQNIINPTVAISLSKDGGFNWGNPLVRSLGQQQRGQRIRASVKSMGLSGPMGCRWRLDISDAVYVGFLKGTQASDPREVGQ